MYRSFKYLLFAVFIFFNIYSTGQTIFEEGFSLAVFPPTGWASQTVSGSNWVRNTSDGSSACGSGNHNASLASSSNAWLFTESFTAIAGNSYDLSYYSKNTGSRVNAFEIYIGSGAQNSSNIIGGNLNSDPGNPSTLYVIGYADTWICPSNGTYWFGIRINTVSYTTRLDCIKLIETAPSCIAPTSVALSGYTTPICTGNSPGTFTATPTDGLPTLYTYLWYKDGISTGISTSTYDPGVLSASADIYCAVSTGAGCTTNSPTQTIVVNDVPIAVTATASPNPICPGATLNLTGNSTGAISWSWTGPNSFSSTLQNPTIPGFAVANEGVYTLTATNACGSAAPVNTASVLISSSVPTAVTASASPNPICIGSDLNLIGNAAGAETWSWTGPNSFSSSLQNPTISSITTAGAGVYTLIASNCVGSAAGVSTSSVTVVTGVPTSVTATATPNPVDQGNTLTLTGSATGATSWSWSGPNSFSSSLQNPTVGSIPLAGAGVYSLVASNACGSASTANTAAVTVNPIGNIYYINDNSTTGDVYCTAIGNNSNNGTSINTPKLTLKDLWSTYGPSGSNVLTNGDIIYIDAGTYSKTGFASVDECCFNISVAGLSFIGAGNTLTIFDHNHHGTASTEYFMYISADNISIKDMTIQEYDNVGTATPGHSGQAITVGNSSTGVLIENVIFSSNGASGGNPSISVLANCSVTIRGGGGLCNVWHTSYTGGIETYGNGITLNIEDYVFAYNFKTGAFDGGGLLISNTDATTTVNVSNSYFYNNEASDGGAISQRGGVLNVTDCIIDGNLAGQTGLPIYGAGVRMVGGTATYTRTLFTNNSIGSAGGSLYGGAIGLFSDISVISLTLDNCLFENNSAVNGDDIYAETAWSNSVTLTASNTTFSNSTKSIYNKDANIQLTDCGDPNIQAGCPNSPSVVKVNTNLPSSAPNPTTPGIFSGDCSTGITLPIELAYFKGSCINNSNVIRWETESEINNDFFLVERSIDGLDFIEIAVVSGSGNSNNNKSYEFIDNKAKKVTSYYRLTQVDYNGNRQSSNIIAVEKCHDNFSIIGSSYFVNETKEIVFDYLVKNDTDIQVSIFDISGKLVYYNAMNLSSLSNQKRISLENEFSSSIYILNIRTGEESYNNKLVIQD